MVGLGGVVSFRGERPSRAGSAGDLNAEPDRLPGTQRLDEMSQPLEIGDRPVRRFPPEHAQQRSARGQLLDQIEGRREEEPVRTKALPRPQNGVVTGEEDMSAHGQGELYEFSVRACRHAVERSVPRARREPQRQARLVFRFPVEIATQLAVRGQRQGCGELLYGTRTFVAPPSVQVGEHRRSSARTA